MKVFVCVLDFAFFSFFCFVLVDLHCASFDFSECESELVSGFNVEYSGVGFAALFLGEYGNLLYFSWLTSSFLLSCFLFFMVPIELFFAFLQSYIFLTLICMFLLNMI